LKSADVRRSAARVRVARAALLLGFAALSLRAAHLAVFDQRGSAQGDAQSLRTVTLAPERGQVVDRSGATLALSVDAPSVYAVPERLRDPADTARQLARILDLDRRRLARRLSEHSAFRFVARWVEPEKADRVAALGIEGVGIVKEPRRVYPHKSLAARVIGFANIDGRGVRGVEQQEDDWLRGTTRRLPVERDGSGRLMLMSGSSTWGTAGGDVALTLDAAMQADAERALDAAIERTGARGGIVISMDPASGEIFALAEAPSFDPNHFRNLDYDATGSGAFLAAIEPGSSFKSFLVAAALESGAIEADEKIDCGDGSLRVPGKTIHDHRAYGELDPAGVLRVSSNVGAVKIAQQLGESRHFEMLQRFGFGRSTGSHFPDESAGLLRPWQQWKPVDHATIAFGQGVSVTPIQLAAATAVLANGGHTVRPRLVSARRVADGPWQPTPREPTERVLHEKTARRVVAMLETVVSPEGTGRRAALPGIRVAGKTGTAQKWDAHAGSYSNERFRAWFVGIVPADAPRLVIVAGLDEPKRPQHTGGAAAAPLFARVAADHLARFGIFPRPHAPETRMAQANPASDEAPAAPELSDEAAGARAAAAPRPAEVTAATPRSAEVAAAAPRPAEVAAAPPQPAGAESPEPAPVSLVQLEDRVLLPDFTGLSVAEVTRITESRPVIVRFQGRGRAVHQDPPPGTIVPGGTIVTIEFGDAGNPTRTDAQAGERKGRRTAADVNGGVS
jgi:cell division protein FtsI (penicillin-binding protein 3)